MTYPVFIVCRDRLTCLLGLLDWLEAVGHDREVYLIDNDSSYPPLLDFYKRTRHKVLWMGGNYGHRVGWTNDVLRPLTQGRKFVYTDPDVIPIEGCPPDAIERMAKVLDKDGAAVKCGFGIKVDDLPDWCRDGIQAWEARFWNDFVGRVGGYRAPIDTTFALYAGFATKKFKYKPAWRLPEPYLLRHLPWYVDPNALSDEDEYYRAHADIKVSNWSRYVVDHQDAIKPQQLASQVSQRWEAS